MVSLETITQTSNRKLATLFNSPVSSSLRMEVLITNLLGTIERGEFPTKDLDLEDQREDLHRKSSLKRKRVDAEDDNGGEISHLYGHEDLAGDSGYDLVPSDTPTVSASARILSRKLTVPVPEDEDEDTIPFGLDSYEAQEASLAESTAYDNEPPSPTGCTKKHHRLPEPPKKRHDYRVQLEDIEIEVVEEGNSSSSDEHELSDHEGIDFIRADSAPKSPLLIRIKMPAAGAEVEDECQQKKRKRSVDDQDWEGGDEQESGLDGKCGLTRHAMSPKKKLKAIYEGGEARTQ